MSAAGRLLHDDLEAALDIGDVGPQLIDLARRRLQGEGVAGLVRHGRVQATDRGGWSAGHAVPALLKDWGQQEFAKLPGRLVTAVQILTLEQTTVWHTARMPDEHSLESDVETSIIQSGFRVRLRAPFSIASVQTFSRRHINVEPDGTIEMSADDAQYPRMASGIGGRPRKSGSHWTPRWREMDSNPRSPAIGRPPRDDRIRKRPGRQWVALSTVVSLRSV